MSIQVVPGTLKFRNFTCNPILNLLCVFMICYISLCLVFHLAFVHPITLPHKSSVNVTFFTSNGQHVVTGSSDGFIHLWNVRNGQELDRFKADNAVFCAALSPDGKRLATGGADSLVRVWELSSKRLLTEMKAHFGPVYCICFSPDGKRLASGGGGERSVEDDRLLIWDVIRGQQILTIHVGGSGVRAVSFSADGKRLAIAPESVVPLYIFDSNTGKKLTRIETKDSDWGVNDITFSPNGHQIATSSMSGTASVWKASNGKRLLTLKGHSDWVLHIGYSPDGKHIVTGSGSNDKSVRIWDTVQGHLEKTLVGHQDYISSVAFSPDSKHLVTGSGEKDRTAKVWNVN